MANMAVGYRPQVSVNCGLLAAGMLHEMELIAGTVNWAPKLNSFDLENACGNIQSLRNIMSSPYLQKVFKFTYTFPPKLPFQYTDRQRQRERGREKERI
ncbi:hypothetical protein STEG23_030440, partial [Scotinomys teguina]